MKAEYINPFVTSTMTVFGTMLGMKPIKKDLYIKKKKISTHEISGFIGLAGHMNGSVTLSFSQNVALLIAETFLGESKTDLDDDVVDVIGEMVNMVAGGAKKEFVEQGKPFKISIPSIITGKGHMLGVSTKNPCFGVTFELDGDFFDLEVAINESKNTSKA